MNIIARVQAILLKPWEEWGKIKAESTPIPQLFLGYAALLAAIPAIAQFIGFGLVGRRVLSFGLYRWSIGQAFLWAVFTYITGLVTAYLLGMIINALAPNFGSKPNPESAMKLAVYGLTPAWIGGIFYIIPALSILATLASLYGIYVMYVGFSSPMMDTPKEKVVGYLVVSLVVAVILMLVFSLILGGIFAFGRVPVL